MDLAVLITPLVKGAYFAEYIELCRSELSVLGAHQLEHHAVGGLDFFHFESVPEDLDRIARLACVQGLFKREGDGLIPLDVSPGFQLHSDFVFGTKYRGKTHELLTQYMLNLGLFHLRPTRTQKVTLLDPMCGRGTTLLWAVRYGVWPKALNTIKKALADIRQSVKSGANCIARSMNWLKDMLGSRGGRSSGNFFVLPSGTPDSR